MSPFITIPHNYSHFCSEYKIGVVTLSAKKQELELPYIGINVDRLPQLIEVVLNSKIKSRSGLRDIYARKFQCSQKTAKEYVSSLINLNVLTKDGLDMFAIKYEPNTEPSVLLDIFYAKEYWPSFFEFLISTNPVFEVLREIVIKVNPSGKKMTVTELKGPVLQLMVRKRISGSLTRRQTMEAFLRIFLKSASQKPLTEQKQELPPQTKSAIATLNNKQSDFLNTIQSIVKRLKKEVPIYKEISIISFDDVIPYLTPEMANNLTNNMIGLRDRGLLFLHATIQSAAEALGVKTIEHNGTVYSAFSLTRSLMRE